MGCSTIVKCFVMTWPGVKLLTYLSTRSLKRITGETTSQLHKPKYKKGKKTRETKKITSKRDLFHSTGLSKGRSVTVKIK